MVTGNLWHEQTFEYALRYFVQRTEFANVTKPFVVRFLPVEEWLACLAFAPFIVVEVQVVPIPMPWVDLHRTTEQVNTAIKVPLQFSVANN
jgi:stringent starvation protein B